MAYKFVKERARQAFVDGIGRCPYPPGSREAMEWVHAWTIEEHETEESVLALRRQYQREHHA